MARSNVVAYITHGSQTSIRLTNDVSLTTSNLNALPNNFFDNVDFVYYGACNTGTGGASANNLVTTTHNKGAGCVLGFNHEVLVDETNIWTVYLMESLAQGMRINEAIANADNLYSLRLMKSVDTVASQHRIIVGDNSVAPFWTISNS